MRYDGVGIRAHRLPLTAYAVLLAVPSLLPAQAIQDNSFLVEEAYNQEEGVVQHISAFTRGDRGDWVYSFTQEWPLTGMRHQVSYSLPVEHSDGGGTGIGDVGINYRHQLAGMEEEARLFVAPRASLLLPTGREEEGRGSGALGFQVNFPVTYNLSPRLDAHWNAGATLVPSARNPFGQEATTGSFNLAASAIWLVRPTLNLVLELLWLSEEAVTGPGRTDRDESVFLNPGVRWAFNFDSGLQIVPGLAYTIGLGPSNGEDAVFVYLSFEHPFKRVQ